MLFSQSVENVLVTVDDNVQIISIALEVTTYFSPTNIVCQFRQSLSSSGRLIQILSSLTLVLAQRKPNKMRVKSDFQSKILRHVGF